MYQLSGISNARHGESWKHWTLPANWATLQPHAATTLEALKGNRLGQHSVRINDQYRICFIWQKGDASEVEIVDYHR